MTVQTQQMSIKQLSALYDRIYDIADRLFKKYNPCNIHTKDGIVYCGVYNNKKENENRQKRSVFLCCGGCYYGARTNYSTINGCITKCLACKLHLCYSIMKPSQKSSIYYKLLKIRRYAEKCGLSLETYYQSKEDWLKRIIARRKQYDR